MMTVSSTSTSISSLPFPAVTVCDRKEAKALSDVVAEEIKKDKDWNETETYLKWYCDSSPEGREAYLSGHEGYHKFLNRMTFSCDDLFNYVEFNGMRVGKTKGDLIYRNNECCTFNAVRPEFMFKNISNSAVFNRSEFIIPGVDWNLHTGYPPKTRARTVPLRPNGSDIHSGLIFRLRFKPYCSEETLSKLDFDVSIELERG
ncbi:hypothetical protein C0J52_20543 [Blattella germanica]|nr:hypothetical protein C0J52_20543 [Blattella germanica]